MNRASRKRTRGQSIIETVVGIIFLIPIVLFLFDVAVLVLANTANDNLAKQAARAAASASKTDASGASIGDPTVAQQAAQAILDHAKPAGGYINKVAFAYYNYNTGGAGGVASSSTSPDSSLGAAPATAQSDPGPGNVAVVLAMQARAPVPFPGFDTQRTFWARDVEPIVALPPVVGP